MKVLLRQQVACEHFLLGFFVKVRLKLDFAGGLVLGEPDGVQIGLTQRIGQIGKSILKTNNLELIMQF